MVGGCDWVVVSSLGCVKLSMTQTQWKEKKKKTLPGQNGKARDSSCGWPCSCCSLFFPLCSTQEIAGRVRSRIMHRAVTRRCRRGLGALRSAWCFAIHDKCPQEVGRSHQPTMAITSMRHHHADRMRQRADSLDHPMREPAAAQGQTKTARDGVASPQQKCRPATVWHQLEHPSPAVMQSRSPFPARPEHSRPNHAGRQLSWAVIGHVPLLHDAHGARD